MALTLISHALCPYVQRAVIALSEKAAAYERVDIDLKNKPQWFLDISPLGKTPVLKVGREAIFESAVICEYLEDTIAPALHPADPLQRARHRAWMEFASATLNGIWTFYTAQDEAAYESAARALQERFAQLERALGTGPYFAGRDFSLVDAAFAPVFRYFDVFDAASGVEVMRAAPKVRAWRAALAERASVRKAVGSDYATLLRGFVIEQGGVLGRRLGGQK
ncbi:MAG TPA: glutathione S-transferase family protein [Noviherbaspirillum sp.]